MRFAANINDICFISIHLVLDDVMLLSIYQVGFECNYDLICHSLVKAEPLAETAPIEEVSGAALSSSGIFVPSLLA